MISYPFGQNLTGERRSHAAMVRGVTFIDPAGLKLILSADERSRSARWMSPDARVVRAESGVAP